MNLNAMRQRVWRQLDDDGTYHTPAAVAAVLNEGVRVFCLLTLCQERTETVAVAARQITPVSALTRYLSVLRIEHGGWKVRPSSIRDWTARQSDWRTAILTLAVPRFQEYATAGWNQLVFFPAPVVEQSLQITWATYPAAMSANEDESGLVLEDESAILRWALWRLRLPEGGAELQLAAADLNLFMALASTRANQVRERSRSLGYDRLPLEIRIPDLSMKVKREHQQLVAV